MSSKTKTDDKGGFPISRILITALFGDLLFFILTALFSYFVLKNNISSSLYMPIGLFLGMISALFNGFFTVRPIKEKGVFYGSLTGLIQALLCSVVLFVVNGGAAGTGMFVLAAIIIISSGAGGIIAVNLKFKKKY